MIRNLPPRNNSSYLTVALFCTLAVAGCTKKEQPAPAATPAPTTAAPVQPQAAVPVQKAVSSVKLAPPPAGNQFDFSGKKDPFKPAIVAKQVTAATPDELKKMQGSGLPIHSFDVSQFKLIGIVSGGKENTAMVVDPSGKGYVLKLGMTIGKNDGKITAINAGGVEVVEQFKDDNGRVRKENIRITLPRKQ